MTDNDNIFGILKGKQFNCDPYKISWSLHEKANAWYNQYRTAQGLADIKADNSSRLPWESDIFFDSEMCYPKGQKTFIEKQRKKYIKQLEQVSNAIDIMLSMIRLDDIKREPHEIYTLTLVLKIVDKE